MRDLANKHAVIFGVASESSIAWAIAQQLHRAGAAVTLGYQQRFKSRVLQLLSGGDVEPRACERCDVTKAEEIEAFFDTIDPPIDILVHSIAHANPETFGRPISTVGQEDFSAALLTSAHSLLPLTRAALPKMPPSASVIALSYLGGQRVVQNYKLMGIAKAALEAVVRELAVDVGVRGVRVNAISAGPIRTLSAGGIGDFDLMLERYAKVAPLRRCVSAEDVANMAAFLGSDLSRNITGQTLFVDAGFSIMALSGLDR